MNDNLLKMLFSDDKTELLAKTILLKNSDILINFINNYFSNDRYKEKVFKNINKVTNIRILDMLYLVLEVRFNNKWSIYLWSDYEFKQIKQQYINFKHN